MNPFHFYNPTRILFGEGRISELRAFIPEDARILFVYDEDAIKKNGVYAQIQEALVGFPLIHFNGIRPNPDYDFLIKALPLIREHELNYIVAAGGGSTIDGAKFIAAAAKWFGDPWGLTDSLFLVQEALPLAVVQTHPATGSEVNRWGVVNRKGMLLNRDFCGEALFPRLAILDPTVTLTLPRQEITYGVVDAFSHVLEQYLTTEVNTPLQDRQAEALLLTIIESARAILKNPKDIEARSIFMWCATSVLNDHLQTGNAVDFAAHRISHAITALYDLRHAEAIALLLVPTFSVLQEMKHAKLCRYARVIWGHQRKNEEELIAAGLESTRDFLLEMGAELNPRVFKLDKSIIPAVIDYFRRENMFPLGECHPVYEIEAMAILSQMLA